MRTFLAPWDNDHARYPAHALERHSAHCRALGVPDSTHPSVIKTELTADIVALGQHAVEQLHRMEAWSPDTYDVTNTRSVKADLLAGGYRHFAFWGGRGGSKSHGAAEAIVELASVNFERVVCGREFMASIRDSSYALIKNKIHISPWAEDWVCTDREMRNKVTGSVITFLGINRNPDSARSLEGCTLFFGEEAAAFSQASIDILLPTIRTPGSRCIWLWNPVDGGPVDDMFRGNDLPERSYVRCVLSEDNPWFYRTEMPAERRIAFVKMKPAKFRHVWRGALDLNPERAVYTNWRVDRIFISTLSPLYGLDWGWVDPFACLEFYVIEPDDPETQRGTIYISKEVYGSRIPAKELPDRVRETMPMSELAMIVADSAEPKSIDDFNSAGFNVVGATKGPGSIRAGISFIQGYDIVVSPECPNVAKELTLYMWKQDEKTKRILRDPVDKDNHAMDALRYGLSMYTPPPRGGGVTML